MAKRKVGAAMAEKTSYQTPTPKPIMVGGTRVDIPAAKPKLTGKDYLDKITESGKEVDKARAEIDRLIAEGDLYAAEGDRLAGLARLGTGMTPEGTILRVEEGDVSNTIVPILSDGKGGEVKGEQGINPIIPGSGGGTEFKPEVTLASNTFKNTIALIFGQTEAAQPWVTEMYKLTTGFIKTGSTEDEALNYALYEAKDKGLAPQFTKRFEGVFKLQERLQKGEAVAVPTIAEFIQAEIQMGEVLTRAGMPELANQEFLGGVLGRGKSVLEVGNLISDVFTSIDTAPANLKKDLQTYFPGVDRVQIAKALLTGEAGATELKKKVAGISVLSAAGSQGIGIDLATAGDIAARGYSYEESLAGFGQVKELERARTLSQFQGGNFTQEQAQKYVFEKSQEEKDRLEKIAEAERVKFQGQAGTTASSLRGASARGII